MSAVSRPARSRLRILGPLAVTGIVLLQFAFVAVGELAVALPDQNSSSRYHPVVCDYPCTFHWHQQILLLFLPEIVTALGVLAILPPFISSRYRPRAWTAFVLVTLLAAIASVAGILVDPDLLNAIART